jgi:hypothetical protein
MIKRNNTTSSEVGEDDRVKELELRSFEFGNEVRELKI